MEIKEFLLQAEASGGRSDTLIDSTGITTAMDEMEELKIVLLGKTGVGKSSVGNAILGEEVFTGACSTNSATQICERAEKVINGRRIVVIDTPGIFDTDRSEEELESMR
ncbi:protein lingerer-like [Astyanax mexicanus]|uniref:Protein lingerer-like n=1 Tax=Astyanax mexicanus TaxID=7994 RepID=A0A8T2KTE2_ASTMX|nr:protein lingerer-like [Astyanax mexicanus]